MGRRATRGSAMLLLGLGALSPSATAQSPVDGRIVRVVYQIVFDGSGPRDSTWGFHLAHMSDGRYCVRLGNPGRLNLAIIAKVGDICFDGIPGAVDRSQERTTRPFDVREKGKRITISTYQKGAISASGATVTLKIATCSRPEGDPDYRCFPNRFVVHLEGENCTAEVTLSGSKSRAGATTCEHYEAR